MTTAVENFEEESADDVFVDGAVEQARKCFALERRGEGKRHTKQYFPFLYSFVY